MRPIELDDDREEESEEKKDADDDDGVEEEEEIAVEDEGAAASGDEVSSEVAIGPPDFTNVDFHDDPVLPLVLKIDS